eukprot:3692126-Prymnesium_polylepis.1
MPPQVGTRRAVGHVCLEQRAKPGIVFLNEGIRVAGLHVASQEAQLLKRHRVVRKLTEVGARAPAQLKKRFVRRLELAHDHIALEDKRTRRFVPRVRLKLGGDIVPVPDGT